MELPTEWTHWYEFIPGAAIKCVVITHVRLLGFFQCVRILTEEGGVHLTYHKNIIPILPPLRQEEPIQSEPKDIDIRRVI